MTGGIGYAAALLVLGALVVAQPGGADESCVRSGERVLAKSSVVVAVGPSRTPGRYDGAVGCLRSSGVRVPLDDDDENDITLRPVRASGYWVGYVEREFLPTGEDQASLWVRDLRNPDTARAVDAAPCGLCRWYHSVVLRPRGSVAWIAGAGTKDEPYEVYKCEAANCVAAETETETERLDYGRTIEPRSLRRRGERIYWTKGERRRSAVLG